MNVLKQINRTLFIVILLFSSISAFGQKIEPKKRILEPDHTIASKIMGKDYQLYISFPGSYSTKDTISYPVLYVLDGRPNFHMLRSIQNVLSFEREIEEVIIVAIGSGLDGRSWIINREYDYTTSLDTTDQRYWENRIGLPKGSVKQGGAPEFLECIKKEIIPLIDKNYKTNTDRGISGHSLGGLFTAYCLINSDGYFTRFGINSPSLWWDNEKILNQAVTHFTSNENWDIPPTKVYISVGEKEGGAMVPTMVKFSKYLEGRKDDNINLKWQIFEEESHLSVIPASLSKTLSTLYGKY